MLSLSAGRHYIMVGLISSPSNRIGYEMTEVLVSDPFSPNSNAPSAVPTSSCRSVASEARTCQFPPVRLRDLLAQYVQKVPTQNAVQKGTDADVSNQFQYGKPSKT